MAALVIGLGNIGMEVAVRLQDRIGADGVDLDIDRREEWRRRTGQEAVGSLDEVDWRVLDRVFIIVRSSAAALALTSEIGSRARGPLTCHVMTTLNHDDALSIGSLDHEDVRYLEQPISGGAAGAQSGELTVFTAGPITVADEDFLRSHLAARLFILSAYGQPTLAKLLNNTVAAYHLGVAAWALEAAEQHGIAPSTMHEVLQSSSGASTISALAVNMGPDQGELLVKDVGLLTETVGPPPLIGVDGRAAESSRAAISRGLTGEITHR